MATVGHYIAVELRWTDDFDIRVRFADSLLHAPRTELLRELIRVLTR
jgi:hypothetical protein